MCLYRFVFVLNRCALNRFVLNCFFVLNRCHWNVQIRSWFLNSYWLLGQDAQGDFTCKKSWLHNAVTTPEKSSNEPMLHSRFLSIFCSDTSEKVSHLRGRRMGSKECHSFLKKLPISKSWLEGGRGTGGCSIACQLLVSIQYIDIGYI